MNYKLVRLFFFLFFRWSDPFFANDDHDPPLDACTLCHAGAINALTLALALTPQRQRAGVFVTRMLTGSVIMCDRSARGPTFLCFFSAGVRLWTSPDQRPHETKLHTYQVQVVKYTGCESDDDVMIHQAAFHIKKQIKKILVAIALQCVCTTIRHARSLRQQ